jgi:hypothetical protein
MLLLFLLTISEVLLYALDKIAVMLASQVFKSLSLPNRKEKKEE